MIGNRRRKIMELLEIRLLQRLEVEQMAFDNMIKKKLEEKKYE